MINRFQSSSLDFKAGSFLFSLVLLYATIVFFISPVTFPEYLALIGAYGKTLPVAFIAIFLITQIAGIVTLGIKTKFKASPFAFCFNKLKEKWQQDRFFSFIWPISTLIILIPSFNVFKQTILSERGFTTDPLLEELDFLIFGKNPGLILHEFIGNQNTTIYIDNLNNSWFIPMILSIFLVAFSNSQKLRIRYVSGYIFVWIFIGSIMAYLLPSAGPCFYIDFIDPNHNGYAQLMSYLHSHHNDSTPIKAIAYQQYLASVFGKPIVTIGAGISAMPSVHVALATLFALGSYYYNRYLGILMVIYALLIWIGSIYLGWHYFVDGLVSFILVILFWKGFTFIEKKLSIFK